MKVAGDVTVDLEMNHKEDSSSKLSQSRALAQASVDRALSPCGLGSPLLMSLMDKATEDSDVVSIGSTTSRLAVLRMRIPFPCSAHASPWKKPTVSKPYGLDCTTCPVNFFSPD